MDPDDQSLLCFQDTAVTHQNLNKVSQAEAPTLLSFLSTIYTCTKIQLCNVQMS